MMVPLRRVVGRFGLSLCLLAAVAPAFAQAPTVQIDAVNACVFSSELTVTGSVAGTSAIDQVSRVLNGDSAVLCSDCGSDPLFADTVTLETCDNAITVSATDADGLTGSSSLDVRFDLEGPTVADCPDDVFVNDVYSKATVMYDAPTQVSDNCDASVAAPFCYRSDEPSDPFEFGQTTTFVNCPAFDSCGRPGFCGFTVTVLPMGAAIPGQNCSFSDFRDEVGGSIGFPAVKLGDATVATSWTDAAGGDVTANGSSLGPNGDNGGFFAKTQSEDFRIETPLPTYEEDNFRNALAGLMVRWGTGSLDARVMVVHRDADGMVDFRVRTAPNTPGVALADSIPAAGVTDIAIEVVDHRVVAQYSTDLGNTWITPGGALGGAETVQGSGDPLAGFIVASQESGDFPSGHPTTFRFTYASICPAEGVDPGEPPVDPDPEDPVTGCERILSPGTELTPAALGDGAGLDASTGNIFLARSSELYHGNDNGGFLYRELSGYGDFRVETPVPSRVESAGQTYEKGGLMVRYGLDALAPRVMAMHVPDHPNGPSVQFDVRTTQGGLATELASTQSAAGIDLLAIEKVGDVFTVEVSYDDGASWVRPLGAAGGQAVLQGTGPALAGLAVASYDPLDDAGFLFPELEICGEDEVPPPPPIEPVDGCLTDPFDDAFVDAGWNLLSLGDADQVSVGETDVLQLSADGSSLFSAGVDDGGFLYRAVAGDFRAETVVDVSAMGGSGAYRKSGLMLRAGLGDDAVRFIAQLAPSWNNSGRTALQFRYRSVTGGAGNRTWASNRDDVPTSVHLAIERSGQTIKAFYSLDGGTTWIRPLGGAGGEVTLAGLPETLFIGLNTVSYDAAEAVTGEFDDFSLCAPAAVGGLLWWDQDADTLAGADEPVLPGVQMELRTTTNQPIFTTYTDEDGRFLFPTVEPGDYVLLIDSALGIGFPYFGTVDPDGLAIQEYAVITVEPGQQFLDADFGFRVDGDRTSVPACGTGPLDDFSDDALASFWFLGDFGDASSPTVVEDSGMLAISGDGSSLYAGSDHGVFVFSYYEDNFRVEVDVDGTAMIAGGAYRKAGLMVRADFDDEGPRYIAQLVPYWDGGSAPEDSVLQFRYRENRGGQSDIAWGSNIAGAPRQVRLAIERIGDTLITEYSEDGGLTWIRPSGGSLGTTTNPNLPDTLLVGMNVVSYDAGTPTTALFDDFLVCR